MPERKPYVYRGEGTDTLTPELGDAFEDVPPAPDGAGPCWCGGDMGGYRKHLAEGEKPCQPSRDDVNLYTRNRNRAKREAAR